MGGPATSPGPGSVSFPANDVRAIVEGFGRLGYDTDVLLAGAQITRASLDDPDGRVPCERCGALFGVAQQIRPTRNINLRLAESMPIGAFPLVDYLVVTSDTVGSALKQLARYFRLVSRAVSFEFHEDERPIRVAISAPVGGTLEFDLALAVIHFRRETDGRFGAVSVSIGQAVDDVDDYARVLGCPVYDRAAWSGWLIAPEMWQLPLRRRDPILRGVLERHADELLRNLPPDDGIAQHVRRVLTARIAGGDAGIDAVARELATAPRTLQRRLAAAGSSFQALVDLTRREAAERYLAASRLSIAEIGYLLGYSEVAAFHRAFKRWSGRTPQTFRTEALTGRLRT
jgi:AraC-like DNA-binding protein